MEELGGVLDAEVEFRGDELAVSRELSAPESILVEGVEREIATALNTARLIAENRRRFEQQRAARRGAGRDERARRERRSSNGSSPR
jgi:hypothetical protein